MRRYRGGIDSRTDFGTSLSDAELARRLQEEEFNPGERRISLDPTRTPPPSPAYSPSSLALEEERSRTRNANLQRKKAEDSLRSVKSRADALESAVRAPHISSFAIPLYSDGRFDRLYSWSMDLIPEFEYTRQVRLRRLIEDLIRRRLHLGEPEYLLKDEIKRLIYEAIHDVRRPPSSKKKSAKKRAAPKKSSKKKAPSSKRKRKPAKSRR